MSNISINIFDNAAQVLHKGNVKTIKLESLIKVFSSTESKIETPILPTNTIKYSEKGNSCNIILYHEKSTFTATYSDGTIFENCVRPPMILKYQLNNDNGTFRISNSSAYGIVDDLLLINDNTQLFGLPFPNISSDGWICWGNNIMSGNIKSLIGLRNYIDRLFIAPFNNHLFNYSFLKNFGINDPKDLFKSLQNIDLMPKHYLENLGRDFKLKSIT